MIKRLYIECETCKHADNCQRSIPCLIQRTGLAEKIISGKKWTSIQNYEYVLWEPKINNYLPDDLFEI